MYEKGKMKTFEIVFRRGKGMREIDGRGKSNQGTFLL
jgi:hypothetical protein